MIAAKWFDPMLGVDIHWVLIPAPPSPVPIPTPLPHPFVGVVFDPAGLLVGAAISLGIGAIFGGPVKGITLTNKMPAANTGTEGTNKFILPHFPMPPGVAWAPVPKGLKPPIPGKSLAPSIPGPIPSMDATLITGSKTVFIAGSNACRLGDLAMSCGEPIRLPSSTVLAIPMGPPVLIGGPPALDFMAALMAMVKTSWVSDRLHALFKAPPGSWRSKIICFFTGHPVDVASGMVMTDAVDLELPGPIPFRMERTYYSRSDYKGPLGFGWAHTYDQHIRREDVRIVLHDGDGRDIYFEMVEVDGQTRNHAERITLFRKNNEILLVTKDNLIYHFGDVGRPDGKWYLERIEDHNESSVRLFYDEKGLLVRIIDSAGRVIKYINDMHGRLTAVTVPHPDDPEGTLVVKKYGYDFAGDLAVVADALDQRFTYKYKYHLLVQETNRNGLSFYFAYDGIDKDARCVRTWGDNGIYDHVLIYDKQNNVTIVDDSLGHKTTYMMDSIGAVVKIVDARGSETSYTYDEYDRKVAEKDPLGNETFYKYDDLGNALETVDPDGTKEQIVFNTYNVPLQAVDKMGGTWNWEYDTRLRITERTDPLGRKIRFIYTGKYLSGIADPAGNITSIVIDTQGNLRMVKNPDGSVMQWEYDRLGHCHASTDPHQNRRSLFFDLLGRTVIVDEPDGNRLLFAYDPEGNVVHAKDKQYDVVLAYSGMNKLISRKQYGTEVEFSYDTENRLTEIRNEHGSAYSFTLDACGDVLAESGFDGTRRVYARNTGGQVVRVDRPEYKSTKYTYDKLGRVTGIIHGEECSETYLYREDGSLLEAANNRSIVKFNRDPLGRVIDELQNGYRVSSEYDILGFRTRLTSSLGADQQFLRNRMGDVENVISQKAGSAPWETRFTRDKLGLELQREMSGGLTAQWQRDRLGRPVNHTIASAKEFRRTRSYEWDVNNRLKSITDSLTGITLFYHDAFGNLAKAVMPDGSSIFRAPDAIGNLFRTEERIDRKYGPAGQLLEVTTKRGTVTYEYDVEGNLVVKKEPDGRAWKYFWNGAGMLEKVLRPDGKEVLFTYDALGRRISKTFDGRTTRWVWDGNVPLHEWVEKVTANDGTTSAMIEGDDGSISDRFTQIHYTGRPAHAPPLDRLGTAAEPLTWIFEPGSFTPLARKIGDTYHNIVSDHLGTPLAMFDEEGAQVWSMELDIYGQVRAMEGKSSYCPFRYPGQYEDEETGLYYNRFRYYDPEAGGYVSQDPIGLAGNNPNNYGYVNDVNSGMDPFGLWTYYQLLDSVGNVVYHGITDRTIQERLLEHVRDGKQFSQVSYLDNLADRVAARNLEGSALYHSYTSGNTSLLNAQRSATPGYYHSYDPGNLATGRTLLSEADIAAKMKNAETVNVDSKGKMCSK